MEIARRHVLGLSAERNDQAMSANSSPTPERLTQFAWGFAPPLAIEAAVRHGVFDRLHKGPRTADQLAAETGASIRGLTGILNVLVGLQLLGRDGDRYASPGSAAFLVSSQPGYHMFFHHISDQLLPRWLQLNEIVRSGRPSNRVNQEEEGAQFFSEFVESLFPISFPAASALGEAPGHSRGRRTGERAGHRSRLRRLGHSIGETIATGSRPRGGLAARARGHEAGRRTARGSGPIDRRSGRVFEADFGEGHQVATVGHILHSEGRDRSRRLLKNLERSGAGRHDRHPGIRSERRADRSAAHAHLCGKHAGEHR